MDPLSNAKKMNDVGHKQRFLGTSSVSEDCLRNLKHTKHLPKYYKKLGFVFCFNDPKGDSVAKTQVSCLLQTTPTVSPCLLQIHHSHGAAHPQRTLQKKQPRSTKNQTYPEHRRTHEPRCLNNSGSSSLTKPKRLRAKATELMRWPP